MSEDSSVYVVGVSNERTRARDRVRVLRVEYQGFAKPFPIDEGKKRESRLEGRLDGEDGVRHLGKLHQAGKHLFIVFTYRGARTHLQAYMRGCGAFEGCKRERVRPERKGIRCRFCTIKKESDWIVAAPGIYLHT